MFEFHSQSADYTPQMLNEAFLSCSLRINEGCSELIQYSEQRDCDTCMDTLISRVIDRDSIYELRGNDNNSMSHSRDTCEVASSNLMLRQKLTYTYAFNSTRDPRARNIYVASRCGCYPLSYK